MLVSWKFCINYVFVLQATINFKNNQTICRNVRFFYRQMKSAILVKPGGNETCTCFCNGEEVGWIFQYYPKCHLEELMEWILIPVFYIFCGVSSLFLGGGGYLRGY